MCKLLDIKTGAGVSKKNTKFWNNQIFTRWTRYQIVNFMCDDGIGEIGY